MRQEESEALAHGGAACGSKASERSQASHIPLLLHLLLCINEHKIISSHLISHPSDKNQ
jgi:hypothetical protein